MELKVVNLDYVAMKCVIVWGAGGHALVVHEILSFEHKIVGFIDNSFETIHHPCISEIGVYRSLELARERVGPIDGGIIAIGSCRARRDFSSQLQLAGIELLCAIHPKAIVASSASIGAGTVIAAGAVVNPFVKVGESCILNTSSSVDHESVIESYVHICPGVRLAGKVYIQEASWIGIGSIVKENVTIGKNTIVGAGSTVLTDLPSNIVAYGSPAQFRRINET